MRVLGRGLHLVLGKPGRCRIPRRRAATRRRRGRGGNRHRRRCCPRHGVVIRMRSRRTVRAMCRRTLCAEGATAGGRTHVAAATDEGPQVDVGAHALADQPAVGLVVGLLDQAGELFVHDRLGGAPMVEREPARAPAVNRGARQHMRAQHVMRLHLFTALERGHAIAQIGELPRSLVHDRQRHARSDDLELDGVVIDQGQLAGLGGHERVGRSLGAGRRRRHGRAQGLHHALVPARRLARQIQHQIASTSDQLRSTGLAHQLPGALVDRLDHPWQFTQQKLEVETSSLSGQGRGVDGRGHGWCGGQQTQAMCGKGTLHQPQTTAPEFGSFGSWSLRCVPTRSSRLTPSHIAIAAATNTDE